MRFNFVAIVWIEFAAKFRVDSVIGRKRAKGLLIEKSGGGMSIIVSLKFNHKNFTPKVLDCQFHAKLIQPSSRQRPLYF